MSITVLNYMDHALVSRINEQAAKRAEAAKQSNTDDFAAALADSTKALENSQNTSQTGTTGADTSGISAAQTTAGRQFLWCFFYYIKIDRQSRIRLQSLCREQCRRCRDHAVNAIYRCCSWCFQFL